MGLYASFNIGEAGLPRSLKANVGGIHIEIPVDYGPAFDAFAETFLSSAQGMVPVDTGYLQSSIDAGSTDTSAWASAGAHYAQYVEYGTWKMGAQPYFEPALEEAMEAFSGEAQVAIDEAQTELEFEIEMAEAELEAEQGGSGGGGFGFGGGGGFGQMLAFAGLMVLLFPVLLVGYGIYRTLTDPFKGDDRGNSGGFGVFMPSVIIT